MHQPLRHRAKVTSRRRRRRRKIKNIVMLIMMLATIMELVVMKLKLVIGYR